MVPSTPCTGSSYYGELWTLATKVIPIVLCLCEVFSPTTVINLLVFLGAIAFLALASIEWAKQVGSKWTLKAPIWEKAVHISPEAKDEEFRHSIQYRKHPRLHLQLNRDTLGRHFVFTLPDQLFRTIKLDFYEFEKKKTFTNVKLKRA